jgi:photosystem II stability/assembly factor-like uncharacterized protein
MLLMLIALMSSNSFLIARVPAQTTGTAGERILADEALFTRASLAELNLDVLRSDSVKTYYPIAEGQGPTIQSIRSRYGRPTAVLAEGIPVTVQTIYTDSSGVATEAPPVIWRREMLVLYYGDIGFAVEDNIDAGVVRFVTNRITTPDDEPRTQPQFAPTGPNLKPALAATWGQKPSDISQELRSVNFVSETEGWAAGANGALLHTTNGGDTWSAVSTGADPTKAFGKVRFLNKNAGFVASPFLAGRTLNSGANWTVASLPTRVSVAVNVSHNDFFPQVPELFWTCGDGFLSTSSTTTGGMVAIYNVSSTGTLSEAASIVSFASSSLKYLDMHILDSSGGWVVGASGLIATITLSNPLPVRFQTSGTTQQLNAVQMLNFSSGWAVGNGGTILKYMGDGRWISQPSGTTANLRDVYFLDSNRGWAVGDGGAIVGTTDGGTTWTLEVSGVSADLRSVHAASSNVVFAVGANGTILKRGEGVSGPDFALGFNSASVDGVRGAKAKVVVTITRAGGFTGEVTVTPPDASGEGIVAKFPDPITTSDSTASWKFKIKASAATGPHQLTFTGRDGSGRVRTATVTLMIQ